MTSPPLLPPTMPAWVFTRRGPPLQTLHLTTLPVPSPSSLLPTDILVQTTHVALFQGFAALMSLIPHFTSTPWIPATDFSGVVVAMGSAVQGLAVGDSVFGSCDPKRYITGKYNGALAGYCVVPGDMVARVPEGLKGGLESTAGLAGNGCTAVQFLERTGMGEGMRVLVTGASGGLGTLVVQLVRDMVGRDGVVVGTCSGVNVELVRGLGCDEVIDYRTTPPLHQYLSQHYASKPFDIIIDIAGADDLLYQKSPTYLAPNGVFLLGGKMSILNGGFLSILSFVVKFHLEAMWPLMLGGTPRKAIFHSADIVPESMREVSALVDRGALKGVVDSVYEMEDALKGFKKLETGRARGKIIVHVQDP